jgi:hypothetical protein
VLTPRTARPVPLLLVHVLPGRRPGRAGALGRAGPPLAGHRLGRPGRHRPAADLAVPHQPPDLASPASAPGRLHPPRLAFHLRGVATNTIDIIDAVSGCILAGLGVSPIKRGSSSMRGGVYDLPDD